MLVRFYDNDVTRFDGNNDERIECIAVDDEKPHEIIKNREFDNHVYYDSYYDKYKPTYLALLFEKNPFMKMNEFPVTNGITTKQMTELKNWCKTHQKEKKIIFFDWDQTLSVQNGFIYLEYAKKNLLTEYVMYLLGGKERFKTIQRLFSFLRRNKNCIVYILTNNDSADRKNTKNFSYFLRLIRIIDPKWEKKQLLFGFDFTETKKSNKINYIEHIMDIHDR